MNRNNNKISFISETKNLEYKISSKDDFSATSEHEYNIVNPNNCF